MGIPDRKCKTCWNRAVMGNESSECRAQPPVITAYSIDGQGYWPIIDCIEKGWCNWWCPVPKGITGE